MAYACSFSNVVAFDTSAAGGSCYGATVTASALTTTNVVLFGAVAVSTSYSGGNFTTIDSASNAHASLYIAQTSFISSGTRDIGGSLSGGFNANGNVPAAWISFRGGGGTNATVAGHPAPPTRLTPK
jgi:hypothetical protein